MRGYKLLVFGLSIAFPAALLGAMWVAQRQAATWREVGDLYADLMNSVGAPGHDLATRLEELRATAGLPGRLRERGVAETDLDAMAEEAAGQWTAGGRCWHTRGGGAQTERSCSAI